MDESIVCRQEEVVLKRSLVECEGIHGQQLAPIVELVGKIVINEARYQACKS